MGAQGRLSGGVNYLAKASDSELVESSEGSDRRENELREPVAVMQKVAVELENNKETAIQTKNEIESTGQTLDGVNGDIKGEAQRSIGSVLRKNTGSTKQEETEEEAKLLSKPYLGETRLDYKSAISKDSPTGLDWERAPGNWRYGAN